jgi:hypothetical protein
VGTTIPFTASSPIRAVAAVAHGANEREVVVMAAKSLKDWIGTCDTQSSSTREDRHHAFSALAPEIGRRDKRTRALTSEQVRNDTIRDTMPLMYSTLTGIRSRSSIKANDGTAHH